MAELSQRRFGAIVRAHLWRVRWDLIMAVICILGTTVTALLVPWPMKLIFDYLLLDKPVPQSLHVVAAHLNHGSTSGLLILCGAIVGLALCKGVFAYYQLFLTSRIGYLLVYTLRGELFDHLQSLSLSFHNRARSGELLSKLTSDTNTLKDVFADSALTFTTHILSVVGMFVVMFMVNGTLTLIVATTFPILFFAVYGIYGRVKQSARNQRRNEGRLASRITEILNAVPLVQAYGMEGFERERFDSESTASMQEGIRTSRMEAAASRLVEVISATGTAVVLLFGCKQAFANAMTPGDVLIFASYITQMYSPIRQIARLSTRFSRATVSIERISEILDIMPEIEDRPEAVVARHLRGAITFDHVSFGYTEDRQVLNDVSFRIEPGKRVALVGASGAGKSTIANLLLRFYDPCKGAVVIDGLNVKQYQRNSLRREIGVVLQDSILFGTSIRENIAYGKPDASDAEIENAARKVHAHDFIMAMPDGYATLLSESGSTLSGGQRQRLCLARAIMKASSILVLDEPTSAVDAESQALIRDALAKLHPAKTLIMIAHQFHSIRDFDRILVLHGGRLVEDGTHADLLKLRGHYFELYRLQGGLRVA
jgi:ATP-binding cassette, subfamily B, bacterial